MTKKKYVCVNGCDLSNDRVNIKFDNLGYTYQENEYDFCPKCGAYMPKTLKTVKKFFELCEMHRDLDKTLQLFYKGEYDSAAREAFIVVENCLREKSKLDDHGCELVGRALRFDIDKNTNKIKKKPLIAINNLKTASEINEQKGLLNMLTGFFLGPRNIFQHNHVGASFGDVAFIIMEASNFLNALNGFTITRPRKVINLKPLCERIAKSIQVDYKMIKKNNLKKASKRNTVDKSSS